MMDFKEFKNIVNHLLNKDIEIINYTYEEPTDFYKYVTCFISYNGLKFFFEISSSSINNALNVRNIINQMERLINNLPILCNALKGNSDLCKLYNTYNDIGIYFSLDVEKSRYDNDRTLDVITLNLSLMYCSYAQSEIEFDMNGKMLEIYVGE